MTYAKMTQDNIWIIGASDGIGRALAKKLANDGHHIAISARNETALQSLYNELPNNQHIIATCDVKNYDSVNHAKQSILKIWHKIDKVIFMAGLYQPMSLDKLDIDETKNIIDVNLLGAFYLVDIILPNLLQQDNAQIVFCGSVAGYRGLPNGQPYGATKAGLNNMVESLKAEHGRKIDIKLINPGFVKSRLTDKNDFHMPMRITAEQAADHIAKGLKSSKFEIYFPKIFTLMMKFLAILPSWLYFKLFK